ncbi:hypothetical protein BDV19DRAFT_390552 [Aspergillus venezuelensis]
MEFIKAAKQLFDYGKLIWHAAKNKIYFEKHKDEINLILERLKAICEIFDELFMNEDGQILQFDVLFGQFAGAKRSMNAIQALLGEYNVKAEKYNLRSSTDNAAIGESSEVTHAGEAEQRCQIRKSMKAGWRWITWSLHGRDRTLEILAECNSHAEKSIAARPGPSAVVKIFDDDTFNGAVRKWGIRNGRSGILHIEQREGHQRRTGPATANHKLIRMLADWSRADHTSRNPGFVRCLPFWGYKPDSQDELMVLVYSTSDSSNPQNPTRLTFRDNLETLSTPTQRERLAIARDLAASIHGIQQAGWVHGNLSSDTVWMGRHQKSGKLLPYIAG